MKPLVSLAVCLAGAVLCAAQSADPQSQQPPSHRPSVYRGDPAYEKIASATGGRVYAMDPNHPVDIGDLLAVQGSDREQVLVFASGEVAGSRTLEGPVNDSATQLLVSVTGENTVHVIKPDGSEISSDAAGVRYIPLLNGPIYVISQPDTGTWRVTLEGNGTFSAKLSTLAPVEKTSAGGEHSAAPVETARAAPIDFERFRFTEVAGRQGHEGLFPIQGFPVAGATYPVEATVGGDFAAVQFEFRSIEGEPLLNFRLKKEPESGGDGYTDFAGEIKVPDRPFRVYATGVDMTGHRFQVAQSQEVRPQSFVLAAPRSAEWAAGEPMEVPVTLRNLGAADTFTVRITEAHGLVRQPRTLQLYLSSGDIKEFTVSLDASSSPQTTSTTVVITAARASDPDAVNHAIVDCSFHPAK